MNSTPLLTTVIIHPTQRDCFLSMFMAWHDWSLQPRIFAAATPLPIDINAGWEKRYMAFAATARSATIQALEALHLDAVIKENHKIGGMLFPEWQPDCDYCLTNLRGTPFPWEEDMKSNTETR